MKDSKERFKRNDSTERFKRKDSKEKTETKEEEEEAEEAEEVRRIFDNDTKKKRKKNQIAARGSFCVGMDWTPCCCFFLFFPNENQSSNRERAQEYRRETPAVFSRIQKRRELIGKFFRQIRRSAHCHINYAPSSAPLPSALRTLRPLRDNVCTRVGRALP